ncbi:hypothetical protein Zmor_006416 [Zophobas morio]|uniref:DUF4817 domain-containing protein n=1 Tax=Zophobas morio TaxID=2755281 RepID=A0AA38MN35_9CUCU|nr:hypothetical protein Zmor_006416 [Zophobas morio]
MVNFTNSDRADMVMLYGVADGNSSLARELWIERFPNRAISCARTFTSVVQHLRDHGTFNLKLTIVVVMGQKEEIGFSQLVVHPTLKVHGHNHTMLTKCTGWSSLIVHVV